MQLHSEFGLLALSCISTKRLKRFFWKSLHKIFMMYINMSETFIKIDSLQHLKISRQTYPTNQKNLRSDSQSNYTLTKQLYPQTILQTSDHCERIIYQNFPDFCYNNRGCHYCELLCVYPKSSGQPSEIQSTLQHLTSRASNWQKSGLVPWE